MSSINNRGHKNYLYILGELNNTKGMMILRDFLYISALFVLVI